MARVQELVTSCLISGPLGLYVCSYLAPPRISHCEKKGGGSHSRCLEASRRTCVCARINTLSFLCWLASQSPWWGVPGNKSDTRASAHTHTGKCADTNACTHKHTGWCLMLIICFPSPAFLRGPACSALDMLKLVEMIDCWMCRTKYWPLLCLIRQLYSSPLRAKDWKVKRG